MFNLKYRGGRSIYLDFVALKRNYGGKAPDEEAKAPNPTDQEDRTAQLQETEITGSSPAGD